MKFRTRRSIVPDRNSLKKVHVFKDDSFTSYCGYTTKERTEPIPAGEESSRDGYGWCQKCRWYAPNPEKENT